MTMLKYAVRRFLYMLLLMLVLSVVAFVIIQLPPGDFLTSYIVELQQSGQPADQEVVDALKVRYGLDRPMWYRYGKWMWDMIRHGDLGMSFERDQPVAELLRARLPITILISLLTTLFAYGVAIPNFLLALVIMYILYKGLYPVQGLQHRHWGAFLPRIRIGALEPGPVLGHAQAPAPRRCRCGYRLYGLAGAGDAGGLAG